MFYFQPYYFCVCCLFIVACARAACAVVCLRRTVWMPPPPPCSDALATATILYQDPSLRYELRALIGSGSYGRVHSAVDRASGVAVAIKAIPLDEADTSAAARAELAREADVLRRCVSPHIVAFHGAFYHDRALHLCVELCEAGSLVDVLRAQLREDGTPLGLAEPALVAIGAGACAALAYLHNEAHVVHRDIKAGNLLLSARGELKLCDFGVSAQLTATMPQRSTAIGTPHWMAPEVVSGGEYAAAADLWSLGITIIECARGRPPHWDVQPALRVLLLITSAPPPMLNSTHNAAGEGEPCSAALSAWLQGCLVAAPDGRQTASQLLAHPWLLECNHRPEEQQRRLLPLATRTMGARAARAAASAALGDTLPQTLPASGLGTELVQTAGEGSVAATLMAHTSTLFMASAATDGADAPTLDTTLVLQRQSDGTGTLLVSSGDGGTLRPPLPPPAQPPASTPPLPDDGGEESVEDGVGGANSSASTVQRVPLAAVAPILPDEQTSRLPTADAPVAPPLSEEAAARLQMWMASERAVASEPPPSAAQLARAKASPYGAATPVHVSYDTLREEVRPVAPPATAPATAPKPSPYGDATPVLVSYATLERPVAPPAPPKARIGVAPHSTDPYGGAAPVDVSYLTAELPAAMRLYTAERAVAERAVARAAGEKAAAEKAAAEKVAARAGPVDARASPSSSEFRPPLPSAFGRETLGRETSASPEKAAAEMAGPGGRTDKRSWRRPEAAEHSPSKSRGGAEAASAPGAGRSRRSRSFASAVALAPNDLRHRIEWRRSERGSPGASPGSPGR